MLEPTSKNTLIGGAFPLTAISWTGVIAKVSLASRISSGVGVRVTSAGSVGAAITRPPFSWGNRLEFFASFARVFVGSPRVSSALVARGLALLVALDLALPLLTETCSPRVELQ